MSALNWKNLKQNKCPKCRAFLTSSKKGETTISCNNDTCDFTIGADRMSEIVANMAERELDHDTEHFREEGWG